MTTNVIRQIFLARDGLQNFPAVSGKRIAINLSKLISARYRPERMAKRKATYHIHLEKDYRIYGITRKTYSSKRHHSFIHGVQTMKTTANITYSDHWCKEDNLLKSVLVQWMTSLLAAESMHS